MSEPSKREEVRAARERAAARSEAKNQAVRESLEPLEPGERPLAVTIAAIAAMLLALVNLAALIFADKDGLEGGEVVQTVIICALLATASIGMWLVKYWAVLGYQTILGLQIIVVALSLTRVENAWVALLYFAIMIASGVLFWYLIRAMARIQMPESPDIQSLREQREAAEAAAREKEESDRG